jgi:hypothetical protein
MAWIVGVLGAVLSRLFTWILEIVAYRLVRQMLIAVAVITVFSALFIGVVVTVKSAVVAVRVLMPPSLAAYTYFLPANLHTILGTIVTIRVAIQVYRWMVANLNIYASRGSSSNGPLM